MYMNNDYKYLTRAFELARIGRFTTTPNPNVGCVIVSNNNIVGEGYHIRAGDPHAEIKALNIAGDAAKGATVYVTLEPCNHHGRTPPCTIALIKAGVAKVIAAMTDPNPKVAGSGFYSLQKAGIEVHHSMMLHEAETINQGFIKRMRTGLPWLRLKMAASLDGRTALSSGESKWITSLQSRQDVQQLRAESDAIMSTSATILADNPSLTVRWPSLSPSIQSIYPEERLRQPIRIIIDSKNRVTTKHQVVKLAGRVWLACIKAYRQEWPPSVEILTLPSCEHNGTISVNLVELMICLGNRQVNSILVESGPSLAGCLLSAGLVDELVIYQAPKLLGDSGRPLFLLPRLNHLKDALALEISDIVQIGPDIRITLKSSRRTSNL